MNPALGPGARAAVKLTLESAKELSGALAKAIAAADPSVCGPAASQRRHRERSRLILSSSSFGRATARAGRRDMEWSSDRADAQPTR
jgi:hypothetical protein